MSLEPEKYAAQYLKDFVEGWNPSGPPTAYLFERVYPECDGVKHPALRDRTLEYKQMLQGFTTTHEDNVEFTFVKGGELARYGFPAVGAQYSAEYIVMWSY
jgi:hypothetical protein